MLVVWELPQDQNEAFPEIRDTHMHRTEGFSNVSMQTSQDD